VWVNVICPGFVKTPMTDVNAFPMPFLMEAERAAQIMKKGLEANCARIAFPWPMAVLVWGLAALPPLLTDWLFAKLPRKGG
jgi:short-subunit dehydrogenase